MADVQRLELKDGRTLAYAEYGDPAGVPVIAFHGMPGSRLQMKAASEQARAVGVRLIAPDRPGYGMSEPHPRQTLRGYPEDVRQLADALGLDRFAVMGVSGGGPYALSAAYGMPDRLSAAGVVSGIGPLRLRGSLRGMARINRIVFSLGRVSPALVGLVLPLLIKSSLPSMEKQVQSGKSPSADLSPELFAIVVMDQREAIRQGGKGVVPDMRMLWKPWGFRLRDISVPVHLWHGAADDLAPTSLARYVASRVPGCEATFYPGEGHADPLSKHIGEILHILQGVHTNRAPNPVTAL